MEGSISEDDFMAQPEPVKLRIIWTTMKKLHEEQLKKCLCRGDKCTLMHDEFKDRLKKVENRKYKDKAIAGAAGIIGGFLAHLLQRLGI